MKRDDLTCPDCEGHDIWETGLRYLLYDANGYEVEIECQECGLKTFIIEKDGGKK